MIDWVLSQSRVCGDDKREDGDTACEPRCVLRASGDSQTFISGGPLVPVAFGFGLAFRNPTPHRVQPKLVEAFVSGDLCLDGFQTFCSERCVNLASHRLALRKFSFDHSDHSRILPVLRNESILDAYTRAIEQREGRVIALPKMPAVTPPSVIVCHRPANDVDKIAYDGGRHAGQTDGVECGQAIQEIMNDVVRYADVTHRVDYRRQHVRQSHHGDVILGARFFVLRHAEAIAA